MDILTVVRKQWDRVAAMACALLAAVLLFVGWLGVSGTAFPAEQVPYVVSCGISGFFLVAVASTLWLSADLRDEWRKLDRIERRLVDQGVVAPPDLAAAMPAMLAAWVAAAGAASTNGRPPAATNNLNKASHRSGARRTARAGER